MEWLALKHPLLVHLPIAAALLLPLPLLAAQRAGRGIKPWWNTCRYLAWAGVLLLIPSAISGLLWGRALGLLAGNLLPHAQGALENQLRSHEIAGLASLALGVATLWSLYRGRKDHEGLGLLSLGLGCAWAIASCLTALSGNRMTHASLPPRTPAAIAPLPRMAEPNPEAVLPLRALDFAALQPLQAEPFQSPEHGKVWARTWLNPAAAEAHRKGEPLPAGSWAVLSTVRSRWGRPGPEPGPLYFLERTATGQVKLALYWAQIPEDSKPDFGGESRVYWRDGDAHLQACLGCHAQGFAERPLLRPLRARRTTSR